MTNIVEHKTPSGQTAIIHRNGRKTSGCFHSIKRKGFAVTVRSIFFPPFPSKRK